MQKRIFSDRLREIMERTGTTQIQVAEAAAVTQPTVSRWLEGQMPKADDVWRLAQYFHTTMDWFLRADGEEDDSVAEGEGRGDSVTEFYVQSSELSGGAEALRLGATRFGRLNEMLPRIMALEREAAALRALVEEMVGAGYTRGAGPPTSRRTAESAKAGIPADILEGVEAELAEKAGQMSKPRKRGKR